MAVRMQIQCDLCSLLREGKTVATDRMRKDLKTQVLSGISQAKKLDDFGGGKHARDMYAELKYYNSEAIGSMYSEL